MKDSKIVHYMQIPLDVKPTETSKTCFIVYSSRETHIEITIDAIESVLEANSKYNVKRLATHGMVGYSQYSQLIEFLNKCAFAVIILDGFRPNVLFEYGVLVGLRKPCIVLLEENATIDIQSLLKNSHAKTANIKIDIDKDFSDVKDQMYLKYNYTDPKKLRTIIKDELSKLESLIEESFRKLVFPEFDFIEREIKESITAFTDISKKTSLTIDDEVKFRVCVNEIEKISKRNSLELTLHYFSQKINALIKFQKYEEALQLIDDLVVEHNDDTYLLAQKSHILTKIGDIMSAMDCLNDALKIEPDNESLWHQKAILLERQNKKEEAALCYKKGIEYNDGCSSIYYHYGLLLLDNDDENNALQQFEKAIKLRPSDARYLVCKAICLNSLDKTSDAIDVLKEAICFDENNADAWYQLGLMTESYTEAIKYYDKCLSIRQNHTGALCSKGASLSNMGRFEEACKYLSDAVALCIKYDGKGCSTANCNLARTKFQLYMTKNSDYKELLNEAIKHFTDALEFTDDPEEIEEIYNNVGYLNLSVGNIEDALKYLNIAIAMNSSDSKRKAVTYYNIALAYLACNDLENAKDNLDKSERLASKLTAEENICYSLLVPEIVQNSKITLQEKHDCPDLSKCLEIAEAVATSMQGQS
ncbi:tetratricopeptide repeat protein [Geobacter sulfurreducens]|uniref:tetratricopeptide repeat protein n=1 Tax=Geobacter sulfurreducens TaxID=35554 RepID=UPI002C0BA4D6|nr:tetratricopeptide repeat protein [Geobacter sulfurreducens]HML78537.1 tetratricopeptide repeat protein [Geobacter sulfurreducens]